MDRCASALVPKRFFSLVGSSYHMNRETIPVTPNFTDSFEDGTQSAHWLHDGEVIERNGNAVIVGGPPGERSAGLRSALRFGGSVTVSATLQCGKGKGAIVQLHRDPSPHESTSIDRGCVPGGGRVSINPSEGTVDFNSATEYGSDDESSRVASDQIVAGKRYQVTLAWDATTNRFTATVEGNGKTTSTSREFGTDRYSGPFRANILTSGSDVDVYEAEVTTDVSFDGKLNITTFERAIGEEDTPNKPFTPFYPKEAAGVEVDGRYYAAVAGWNTYPYKPIKKDIVLYESSDPFNGWKQISTVTDDDATTWHSPGIAHHDGELWILADNEDQLQVHGLHAPITDIPANPQGWTDEGVLIDNARDVSGILKEQDEFHVFFSDLSSGIDIVSMKKGSEFTELEERRGVHAYSDDGGFGFNQAPDVLPDGNGGYLMTVFNNAFKRIKADTVPPERGSYVAYSDGIDGYYTSPHRDRPDLFAMPGNIAGSAVDEKGGSEWYSDWVTHFVSIKREDMRDVATHNGYYLQLFEGGDGEEFAVGVAGTPVELAHRVANHQSG